MILVATLLCDRKAYSQLYAVPRLFELSYPDITIYINIQTVALERHFSDLLEFLSGVDRPYHLDIWGWRSTWWEGPRFDQDQRRLVPIVMARNMAIEAAMALGASHLFQVDADVIVPRDSIERLLELDRPIVGGLVPGRGCHSHVHYVSARHRYIAPNLIEADHGTAGFMLIRRDVFERLRYRHGPSSVYPGVYLSEDPAYTEDAREKWGFGSMWLRTDLVAEHRDNPDHPLTESETAQF